MLPLAAIGTTEIILIVFVVLLLFGARKLPELARSLGSSVNEFKKGMSEGPKDAKTPSDARPASPENSNGSTRER